MLPGDPQEVERSSEKNESSFLSLLAFCLILSVYWYYIELDLYSNSEIADRSKHGGDAAMSDDLAPIEVFCSYSHEDESHLRDLNAHLSGLQRQGRISTWYDRQFAVHSIMNDEIGDAIVGE